MTIKTSFLRPSIKKFFIGLILGRALAKLINLKKKSEVKVEKNFGQKLISDYFPSSPDPEYRQRDES